MPFVRSVCHYKKVGALMQMGHITSKYNIGHNNTSSVHPSVEKLAAAECRPTKKDSG